MVYTLKRLGVLGALLLLTACAGNREPKVVHTTTDKYGVKTYYAERINEKGEKVIYECISCAPSYSVHGYPIRSTVPRRITIIRR